MSLTSEEIRACTMIALDQPPTWPEHEYPSDTFCFTVQIVNYHMSYTLWANLQFSGTIDWGDGVIEEKQIPSPGVRRDHYYSQNGIYHIKMVGIFNALYGTPPNNDLIISIDSPLPFINSNTISSLFDFCYNLTSINKKLFKNCSHIKNFSRFFEGCSGLTELPSGLLNNCTAAENFYMFCNNCKNLISIPSGLFKDTVNAYNFNNCFSGCQSLISIPNDLFKYTINATVFSYCFYDCKSLTYLPNGLFSNIPNAYNFDSCFLGCSSLIEIPSDLFDGCEDVLNFHWCFYRCTSLEYVPSTLFNNLRVSDFTQCFGQDGAITSFVPELWLYYSDVSHAECFWMCFNAANYSSIPSDWK